MNTALTRNRPLPAGHSAHRTARVHARRAALLVLLLCAVSSLFAQGPAADANPGGTPADTASTPPATPTTIERDGVKATIKAVPSGAQGYSLFEVTAVNSSTDARSLHATIVLTWVDPARPPAARTTQSNCTAYLELKPGRAMTESVPCRGEKFSSFEFRLVDVYPFVLAKSPLTWQNPTPAPAAVDTKNTPPAATGDAKKTAAP